MDTSQKQRTTEFWNQRHRDPAGEAHDNFLSHPLIQAYMSIRAFGTLSSQMDTIYYEILRRTKPGAKILSVGCGRADKERWFATKIPDREFVGIDIAHEIVSLARDQNAADRVSNLRVDVGDFNVMDVGEDEFAMILGLGAIHHVERLETFWGGVMRALEPGGVCVAAEYIGPSRFQWGEAQLEACNRALREIVPDTHKTHHRECVRPSIEHMKRSDPSEAVRSAEIIPTAEAAGFDVHGFCSGGGALLQPVLWYQIASFDPQNWIHSEVLGRLFAEEDRLMREGLLQDDFGMFVVEPTAQRRG